MLGKQSESNEPVTAVCTDTRKITKGCIFVALEGERFDGHKFINTAFENGAVAAIAHKAVKADKPVIMVEDTTKALGDIAREYRKSFGVKVVGVTGSVGKTSTKEMIYAVLSNNFKTLKTEGNFNNHIGLPMTMFNLDKSFECAVIEMGMSHFSEIDYLSGIARPDIGVITNIGVSHIENLKSREGILKAKLEILNSMDKDAPLVVCSDNDLLSKLKLDRNVVTYGIKSGDIRVENPTQSGYSTSFEIHYKGEITKATIPTIGEHNLLNAACAFAVGKLMGMSNDEISKGLSDYKTSGMRQNVYSFEGKTIIEDCYNASPDSMKSALCVLKTLEGKRKIAVLGDMLELGENSPMFHRQVGELVKTMGIDVLLCYGENSKHIIDGAGFGELFDDKQKLASYIKEILEDEDTMLVKASRGMKLEEVIPRGEK